ncbi:putative hydrolase [[Clostridium] ultunense Esp]|uniref:Putative hydrolase n=1 Tax=[Clostridium] ultunense Esp TaxID=1288971 RepID=M1Z797_9FIRM|nr:phosphotriesterase-related protein [Schnuerera ultunensis]CCQ93458.1 putative hydrolase [[Clostridium] ultunense Esp]SHD76405.1 putative hydrolase [[Clostridium] ultunense Esp]
MITTVKGKVKRLGKTYIHEHIKLDLSGHKKDPDTNYNDTNEVMLELKELKKKGIDSIVEVTNRGMGRDVLIMVELAERTGLNIIASTGFYKEPFLPQYFYQLSDKELSNMLIKDIEEGMDGTHIKAHVLGEVGTSHNRITDTERRLFYIIGNVHLNTGRPIFTHTTLGTMALEQIQILEERNVDLEKVLIGHMDLNYNMEYHLRVADKGCYLGFDTIGKINYQPDENRIQLIKELVARGHENQIVLSLDLTRKSHLKKYKGIGYSYIVDKFIPLLIESGIKEETISKFLVDNPNRLLNIS